MGSWYFDAKIPLFDLFTEIFLTNGRFAFDEWEYNY